MNKKALIFVLALMFLVSGCSSGKRSANKEIEKLGPEELVKVYYSSLGEKDYDNALACLSDEMAENFPKLSDSDFKNLKSVSNVKVKKGLIYGETDQNTQVIAEYDAEFKKVITSQSGRQIRFINVSRKDKESPWKIISIGCGP